MMSGREGDGLSTEGDLEEMGVSKKTKWRHTKEMTNNTTLALLFLYYSALPTYKQHTAIFV